MIPTETSCSSPSKRPRFQEPSASTPPSLTPQRPLPLPDLSSFTSLASRNVSPILPVENPLERSSSDDFFQLPSSPLREDFFSRRVFGAPTPSRSEGRATTPFIPRYAPTLDTRGIPKAPGRYDRVDSLSSKCGFFQKAVSVQLDSAIRWRGKSIPIHIREDLMTGQFNVIAEITDGQEPLFEAVANESLILKTFRDHSIMSKGPDRLEPNAHLNVLKQYKDLLEAEVPVAKIYNADEAEAGCGYFLLEKIPHPFEMAWAKGAPLADLSDEAKEQLAQLKDIFAKSYQHRIIADLQPGNLRVRDNCELVLTDLRENKIDDCELDLTFEQMLTFFNCKKEDEIYRYLNPMK